MASDESLYGIRKPKNKHKEISSSTSLAFSSTLSSLISSTSSSRPSERTSAGRPRPSKNKPDIFSTHNKNSKKRAAQDLEEDNRHAPRRELGAVEGSELHRSKRKMEEKARLYAAMKRGDYVPGANEPEALIDFDRKWAENEARGHGNELDTSSDDDGGYDDGGEMVDYEDEYGRAKRGTRAEAERMERRKTSRILGAEELDRMSARPAMPSQLIYGDTVQTAAFNPDEPVAAQMEELARKRDRSATPPEAKHYEADKEIRTKGVGFYSFSKDEATRGREMEALERERLETERVRKEKEERKDKRRQEIEERRRAIAEKRAKKQADSFLEGLSADMISRDDEGEVKDETNVEAT
ncbi:hypothetical protein PVAG01_07216 [Phlyctema vagabunda]|uniref:Nuclear speckle splicing regulatory protein 1 N-terminal domain-containing protein n=1 Tax=Phlyctema vagabunda TaxID=108571 RepID=A0ABR4PCK4_9HELO